MAAGGPDTEAARKVFVSYASQDAPLANDIVTALENAGLQCWIAPRDVEPGAQYADEIVRAINESDLVVLILSASAAVSTHVGKEIERASSKGRRIIALRSDATPLPRAFEYFLSESQWIDLEPDGTNAAAEKLARAIHRYRAPQSHSDASIPYQSRAPERRTVPLQRRPLVLVAAGVALLMIAFAGYRAWLAHPRAGPKMTTVAADVVREKSVAVLPFLDMSERHDQEYFGDGMAEEILNLLVRIPDLKVIGRTSSFSFKGKQADLPSIGKALGATYIVEGSVRRSGEHIRVTAQLVDARNGLHLWSDTFEGTTADTLRLQEEIAVRVAHSFDLEVSSRLPAPAVIESPEAYDYYLRGLRKLEENSSESAATAREYFQKSLELAPKFAPAAVEIAETDSFKCADGTEPEASCPRTLASVEAALKLNPRSADAYAIRAQVLTVFTWDWSGAAAAVGKAVELGGSQKAKYAQARLAYALGDMARARRVLEEIMTTNPFDPDARIDLGYLVELRSGHFELAESWMRQGLQITPGYATGQYMLGVTQLMQGKLEEALTSMKQEKIDEGQLAGLALVFSAMNRKGASDAALKAMEQNAAYPPSDFARAYAFRGERERAMKYLEKAYKTHDVYLWYIKDDPLFKNLEGDPRYKAFLRKMNFP